MQVLLLPPLRGGSIDSVIQPSGRVVCVAIESNTMVYNIHAGFLATSAETCSHNPKHMSCPPKRACFYILYR